MKHEPSELWVVEGRKPVLWTMPIYVAWKTANEGVAISALPQLNHKQRDALRKHMSEYGREFNGGWLVFKHELARTARPVTPGSDPECLFSWHLPRLQDSPEHLTEERIERSDFLDSLHQSGTVPLDRAQLEYVWRQFCVHIGEWLMIREKPIDFYLFTLHSSPYRSDWKRIVREDIAAETTRAAIYQQGSNFDLREFLMQPKLFAYHPTRNICLRRVEVEHKKAWWKQQIKIETAKLKHLTPVAYARQFFDFCHRCLQCSMRLFAAFMVEDKTPAPNDVAGDMAGTFYFVPSRPAKAVLRSLLGYSITPRASLSAKPKAQEAGAAQAVSATNGGVSAVPDISPKAQDVRDTGSDVSQSADRKDRTDGVHVCDAGKGGTA